MFEEILTAISTVGFPIAAYIAMFWKMHDQDKKHSAEIEKTTEALNNNTLAITRLVDQIDRKE